MRSFIGFAIVAAGLLLPATSSASPKSDCERWCAANEQCVLCRSMRSCAQVEYEAIKTFRGKGKNYYACATEPKVALRYRECEAWCDRNKPRCHDCSAVVGCGIGKSPLKTFRGPGRNVHACTVNAYGQNSEQNKLDCDRWCAATRQCTKCSTKPGCGRGYKRIKKFGGRGKNHYACRKR